MIAPNFGETRAEWENRISQNSLSNILQPSLFHTISDRTSVVHESDNVMDARSQVEGGHVEYAEYSAPETRVEGEKRCSKNGLSNKMLYPGGEMEPVRYSTTTNDKKEEIETPRSPTSDSPIKVEPTSDSPIKTRAEWEMRCTQNVPSNEMLNSGVEMELVQNLTSNNKKQETEGETSIEGGISDEVLPAEDSFSARSITVKKCTIADKECEDVGHVGIPITEGSGEKDGKKCKERGAIECTVLSTEKSISPQHPVKAKNSTKEEWSLLTLELKKDKPDHESVASDFCGIQPLRSEPCVSLDSAKVDTHVNEESDLPNTSERGRFERHASMIVPNFGETRAEWESRISQNSLSNIILNSDKEPSLFHTISDRTSAVHESDNVMDARSQFEGGHVEYAEYSTPETRVEWEKRCSKNGLSNKMLYPGGETEPVRYSTTTNDKKEEIETPQSEIIVEPTSDSPIKTRAEWEMRCTQNVPSNEMLNSGVEMELVQNLTSNNKKEETEGETSTEG